MEIDDKSPSTFFSLTGVITPKGINYQLSIRKEETENFFITNYPDTILSVIRFEASFNRLGY